MRWVSVVSDRIRIAGDWDIIWPPSVREAVAVAAQRVQWKQLKQTEIKGVVSSYSCLDMPTLERRLIRKQYDINAHRKKHLKTAKVL